MNESKGTLTVTAEAKVPAMNDDAYRQLRHPFAQMEAIIYQTECAKPHAEALVERLRKENPSMVLRARWSGESEL